jgi:sugar phosphate isomerase/epimerase
MTAFDLTRRAWLAALAGAACGNTDHPTEVAARPKPFRLAVCNETFQGASFAEGCRLARESGYTGLEIAPSTLSEDPASISSQVRGDCRRAMEDEALTCVGLHSLLTAPKGELHITTPDAAVRAKSWDYFRRLIDLCDDLGGDKLMILGSSKQREATAGSSVEDAVKRLTEGLAYVAPHAESKGVTIALETLAPHLCNVLTTMEQTMSVVRQVGSPAVQTMFDTHNAAGETTPHGDLIRLFAPAIRHVHVNEMDGRHPGTGGYDFAEPMRALQQIGYGGWISLEVFLFEPSGEVIARDSAKLLREIESRLSEESQTSLRDENGLA